MTLLLPLAPLLDLVSWWDSRVNQQSFVVGGIIRDAIVALLPAPQSQSRDSLPKEHGQKRGATLDVDLMTLGLAKDLALEIAKVFGGEVREFAPFGTAKVVGVQSLPGVSEVDVAHCRRETYPQPGALPVIAEGSLDEDVRRRDFTINTLLLPSAAFRTVGQVVLQDPGTLRASLLDRAGGLQDLDSRRLRILHERSFIDDPTRLFRGARYASRLFGSFEDATLKAAVHSLQQGCLQTISVSRQVKELEFVLEEAEFASALAILNKMGVLRAMSFAFDSTAALSFVRKVREVGGAIGAENLGLKGIVAGLPEEIRMTVLNAAGVSKKRIQQFVAEIESLAE